MIRTIVRNVLSNWVGFAVNTAVIFFLTPFVLRSLGDTRYGVWVLAVGLTGYFGLLDLGFRSGTTQYLTRYLGLRDYGGLNRTASTSVAVLGACGMVVAVAAVLVGWLSRSIFTIPENAVSEVRWCINVLAITTAVQFVFFPYSAVFTATQRFDAANAISIPLRLASAAATYVALRMGYGLVGLCVVNAAGDMIGCLVRAYVACRILPELRLSPRLVSWREFWPVFSYSAVNSLIQGASILKDYSSALMIGLLLPLAALAPFNLAASLVLRISQLFAPISMVFFPVAAQLDAQGDVEKLRRVYFVVSRLFLCTATAITMIGMIWATDFYSLWVGPEFVEGSEHASVVILFRVLMAASTINIGQKIGVQVFLGCRALRALAWLTLAEAIAYVVLMLPLISAFGLLGAAFAALIPASVVQGVLFPMMICRMIRAQLIDYLRTAYVPPCLLVVILSGPLLALRCAVPIHDSWAMLALCGVLAAILAAPVVLWLAFDPQERRRLVIEPLRRRWLDWAGGAEATVAQLPLARPLSSCRYGGDQPRDRTVH